MSSIKPHAVYTTWRHHTVYKHNVIRTHTVSERARDNHFHSCISLAVQHIIIHCAVLQPHRQLSTAESLPSAYYTIPTRKPHRRRMYINAVAVHYGCIIPFTSIYKCAQHCYILILAIPGRFKCYIDGHQNSHI